MEVVFWISVVFIAYTYIGYPLFIWLMSRRRNELSLDLDKINVWPTVDIVIPVYNERQNILRKLENLRLLQYPKEKLRIMFVSDGSNDGTNDLLQNQQDISFVTYATRKGKAYALNMALKRINSDIVVFTDARQWLAPDSVQRIVARLMQPGIGAVSGELQHVDPHSQISRQVGLYWRYEKWIRKAESRIHSTAGVTGALYAIRRKHYFGLKEDTLLDDFEVPIQILQSGYRIVFENGAIVYDSPQENISGERKRKVRTLTGNYQSFSRNLWLFSPIRNPIFLQFISHKVFRILVPYAMAFSFIGSLMANGDFYISMALLQALLYCAGLMGLLWPALRRTRLVSFIVVFLELNWAAVLAFWYFIFQRVEIRWEKT
jgi:cellulose synthase/poly-beta-1,6-N-acetylglucosamine synthase-like glycosyltransferase